MNTKKYSIIGWILIFGVMLGFFYLNKPTEEKIAEQKRLIAVQDSLRQVALEQAALEAMQAQQKLNEQMTDSTSVLFGTAAGEDKEYTLHNDLITLTIGTKGGTITSATLNGYTDQQGQSVQLFDATDAQFTLLLDGKTDNIITAERYFTALNPTDSTLTMRMQTNGAGYLDIRYALHSGSYLVDMDVQAIGMQGFFPSQANSMGVKWNQRMRHLEKGYMFENRYTYLSYKESDENPEHLSEMKNRAKSIETLDWACFKNQFFSTVVIPDKAFTNANLSSTLYTEKDNSSTRYEANGDTLSAFYLKKLEANMTAKFDPTGGEPTSFTLYIGPNHFKTLRAVSKQISADCGKKLKLDKLIYMGWPIVRLVNRYIIVYLFDFLNGWGLNMGIVLLLLTFIVKMAVQPFTHKQFISSAKMRALKPHLDEIAAKYPDPADAMQKQQEQMQVYSKYGVSPMGGCLPSLIQMPIWMALFFFIPNAIELRQESFLWAKDLSCYDDVIHFSGNIPVFGNHISIFCLLFCLVNLFNTIYNFKMQPQTGGDQSQQKAMKWMMYLFPLMFLFTLNNYSSGLNYYYCVSSLMTIVIMFIMRKTTDEKKLLAELEANYKKQQENPTPKRTSGMMARLQAMQEEQERLQREQAERAKKLQK